ncbi:MAG: DUF4290 domain-containing protein [Bacteroidales bacterium]|nr:DUF4290 domain-containing protein [Bacteroidales bacterium]
MQERDRENLPYNTERQKLVMPEYGRGVLLMVQHLKNIGDRAERSEQARAVVRTMELLNPQVRQQENYEQKLWDHLFIISGFDLDIDAPYPRPEPSSFDAKPMPIPMKGSRIRAYHYGRNIEKVLDLIGEQQDGEVKNELIKALATYMRQQYLIWNKDSVSDETIFADIEKLSEGKVKVPEGIELSKISADAVFARPSIGGGHENRGSRNRGGRHGHKQFKRK